MTAVPTGNEVEARVEPVVDERDEFGVVSAIIATRDRPALVRQAISRIVTQDYPGVIETIVVFDGTEPDQALSSSDRRRPVKVMTNSHKPGLPGGRNTGIDAASGTYVAFCDDDDEWLPGKVSAQVQALRTRPDAVLVGCGILIQFGKKVTTRIPDEQLATFEGFLADRMTEFHPSTFMFRRDALVDEIGLVDEAIPNGQGEDYELLLRTALAGPIIVVPAPLVRIHWHGTSFFFGKWAVVIDATNYLIDAYPQFATCPQGLARLLGQRAFAEASSGQRSAAMATARETLRLNRSERRALLAIAVANTPLTGAAALKFAHRFGKGI